jgi:hypothetical protein
VIEFSELLKSYNVRRISGDRYGGEWPRERFRVRGIEYVIADKPKSDLYRDLLPLLNSGRVELLDLPRLADQLTGLERRTARSGKDSIDHAPGTHDDIANAVAGSLLLAHAAAPALWRREALLIEGVPSTMPARCDIVFAVLMADQNGKTIHANASRHSALSYEHAGKIEAQLKAEVAELLARAEAADQADVSDGMSIPEELARREERLAKLAEARAKLEARAKKRFEREMAEHRAKLAARDEKTAASGKEPGGRTPAPPPNGLFKRRSAAVAGMN